MADWIDGLNDDPRPWLLDTTSPAVRHLSLRQLFDRRADDPDVQAAIRSTREILTRLGAKPYLERLENVLAERAIPVPTTRSGAASAAAVPSGRAGSA